MSHRILVVDDESGTRRVLRESFERQSWKVTLCEDGAAAMSEFSRERFDLTVLVSSWSPRGASNFFKR
jgi:DNA-binding response OmpR family regulator